MRITNSMISSKMLVDINRNMRNVNTLYGQISTQKKINFPSDNPILASRALKFRTSVAEAEQFKSNASQAVSWMGVTSGAFNTVTDITAQIRDLLTRGSSDELDWQGRLNISKEIELLTQQLGLEFNANYAGRYVFSGYRTDQPFSYDVDNDNSFNITQSFNIDDAEDIKTYQFNNTNTAVGGSDPYGVLTTDSVVIKLAYKDAENVTTNIAGRENFDVVSLYNTPGDPESGINPTAYEPGNYIKETGELVLDDASQAKDLVVTYEKTNFKKGELNPVVNFDCTDLKTGKVYTMDNQNIQYEFGIRNRFPINTLGKDAYTASMYADLTQFTDYMNRVTLPKEGDLRAYYSSAEGGSLTEPDLTAAVEQHITDERQKLNDGMHTRFSTLLGRLDRHLATVSTEETDSATRVNRIEFIIDRLDDDRINYKALLSDVEDTNMAEAGMLLANMDAVLQASLQIGANIMQISLVNFI